MLRSHTHNHHPVGSALKQELALYIEDLKGVQVIKPGTNSDKLADKVFSDVLS